MKDQSKLVSAYKSGRAFNGAHRDAGTIIHLVPELPPTYSRASFWGDKALCGVKPGRRGNGWAETNRDVNCEKCIKKNIPKAVENGKPPYNCPAGDSDCQAYPGCGCVFELSNK